MYGFMRDKPPGGVVLTVDSVKFSAKFLEARRAGLAYFLK